jgi:hypothetical protein
LARRWWLGSCYPKLTSSREIEKKLENRRQVTMR